MERGPRDLEHRSAHGPHPRLQPVLDETVYKPRPRGGPRIGIAYDLTGKDTRSLKAFWGRYYEGAATGFYTSATPGIQDYTSTVINPDGSLGETTVSIPGTGLRHRRRHQAPAHGRVQRLVRDTARGGMRFTPPGSGVKAATSSTTSSPARVWRPVDVDNALTGEPFTGYVWANSRVSTRASTSRNTRASSTSPRTERHRDGGTAAQVRA